jgi:hypothetical protein
MCRLQPHLLWASEIQERELIVLPQAVGDGVEQVQTLQSQEIGYRINAEAY